MDAVVYNKLIAVENKLPSSIKLLDYSVFSSGGTVNPQGGSFVTIFSVTGAGVIETLTARVGKNSVAGTSRLQIIIDGVILADITKTGTTWATSAFEYKFGATQATSISDTLPVVKTFTTGTPTDVVSVYTNMFKLEFKTSVVIKMYADTASNSNYSIVYGLK